IFFLISSRSSMALTCKLSALTISLGQAFGRIVAAVNPAAPDSTPRRDKNSGWSHVHSLLRACFAASVGNERRGSKRTTWRRWAWCKVEFAAGGIWRRIILPGHPIASGVPRMRRSAPSLRRGALLIRGPCGAWVPALRSSASRCAASGTRAALVEAQQLEQRRQVAQLLARGLLGAADEVEDLAVLQAVIGETPDLAVLVEIDCDHPLVDHLGLHEHHRA